VYLTDHRFSVKKIRNQHILQTAPETDGEICQILICSYQVSDIQSAAVRVDNKDVNVHLNYLLWQMDFNNKDICTFYVDAMFGQQTISKVTEHKYSETSYRWSTSKGSHDTYIFDKTLMCESE